MTIYSPLDQFEVISLISFNAPILGSFHLSFTNLGFYVILAITLILGLHILGNNNFALVPSSYSITLETIYATIHNIVRTQIGDKNEMYIPFIYSLFIFVLFGNLISNVPYNFAFTSSAVICLGLSFTIYIGVTTLALVKHKLTFFSYFVPQGTPLALVPMLTLIELISNISRSFSLGVRLFANLTAGHTLVKILSTFLIKLFSNSVLIFFVTLIPFALFIAILGLEIAVSFIQSIVLTLLVCSYIKEAIYLH